MLLFLIACCLVIVRGLEIIYPTDGQQIPYNSSLEVIFDTQGITLSNFSVSFNGEVICKLSNVFGQSSCTGKVNVVRGEVKIIAKGLNDNGYYSSAYTVITAYPRATPDNQDALSAINIYNIWEAPSSYLGVVEAGDTYDQIYALAYISKKGNKCKC